MAELINAGDPIDFPTGPAVGQPVPDFSLPDQFGNPCRFSETRANARALILFHQSASWWPPCRTQLDELQRALETFKRNGFKVFAISYDSSKVLRDFSEKHGIAYPLLSDEDSRVVREFGILNTHIPEGHEWYGVPYPGTYMIDAGGIVSDKSFVAEYATRESVNDMLQESYGSEDLEQGSIRVITAPHLRARAYFASPTIRSNQLVVLTAESSLDDGVHVYGQPVSEDYVAMELTVDESEDVVVDRFHYPEPEEMYLEAVGERLPVYTGRLEIKAWCKGIGRGPERPI